MAERDVAERLLAWMKHLNYGPVADYFAVRPWSSTMLSGLQAIRSCGGDFNTLVDVGCGLGQLARWVQQAYREAARDIRVIGIDTVFSKLWLGKQLFLAGQDCVCADVTVGRLPIDSPRFEFPESSGHRVVVCHDAFYFFDNKRHVASELARAAGSGPVILGHVHHLGTDRHGVGNVATLGDYCELFNELAQSSWQVIDDRELTEDCVLDRRSDYGPPADALESAEAVSFVIRSAGPTPIDTTRIPSADVPHPMLSVESSDGCQTAFAASSIALASEEYSPESTRSIFPRWPSRALADEYRDASYLRWDADSNGPLPTSIEEQQRRRWRLPAAMVMDGMDSEATAEGFVMSGSSTRCRWAVVGCGWVARDYGIPAILRDPTSDLVALVDADPTSLKRALQVAGASTKVITAGAIRSSDLADVDAVYLATPNHTHRDLVLELAPKVAGILCEKPISIVPGHAEEMLKSCRQHRTFYRTAFDQRHHPAHRTLSEQIRDGVGGRITQIRIHYACWLPSGWSPDGKPHDNWRVDHDRSGGGATIDLAPHGIDLVGFLTDSSIAELSIALQRRVHDYQRCDDGGVITLRTRDDVLASIHVSYACPDAVPRRRLEVIAERGMWIAENTMGQTAGGSLTFHDVKGNATPIEFDSQQSPFDAQVRAFSSDLRSSVRDGSEDDSLLHQSWQLAERQIEVHEIFLQALQESPPL